MTTTFERLPGLPATEPSPSQFSVTGLGTHSEGFVVRFVVMGTTWVGNFQRGLSSYDDVREHPDGDRVIVVAGGQGYVIDPENKRVLNFFGGAIVGVHFIEQLALLVFDDQGIAFQAIGHGRIEWRTRRLSWDGFRNVQFDSDSIQGEAWTPLGDRWHKFSVNLKTGESTGGSYNGPDRSDGETIAKGPGN